MNRLLLTTLSVAILGGVAAGTALASEANRASASGQVGEQDLYGAPLMTDEERAAHRARMQSAKTAEERERLLIEHEAAMQARAKERGISLPDGSAGTSGPAGSSGSGPGSYGRDGTRSR